MRRVYKNLCPARISASIMAANMWKNSLKNVESSKNKILYETLLDFFCSETVLTFCISLIINWPFTCDKIHINKSITFFNIQIIIIFTNAVPLFST